MPRVPPSALGETTADRVMGHRPELLEAWEHLKHALLGPSSTLSPHLKEEVRRTLAQRTGCQFCASLGQPAADHESRKESLAVAFADAAAYDHTAISDAHVKLLLDEFMVPEVVELLIWISFEYAGQMFGCLIGDERATADEKDAFAAAIAQPDSARAAPPPASPTTRR
jgi:alkylhydroperoxidase family enzyme